MRPAAAVAAATTRKPGAAAAAAAAAIPDQQQQWWAANLWRGRRLAGASSERERESDELGDQCAAPESKRGKKKRRASCARAPRPTTHSPISLHPPAQPSPPPPPPTPPPTHGTGDAITGTRIVRFAAYRPAADHVAALTAALGRPGPATWAWVARPNPAAALPTDFGVVRVGGGRRAATKV